MNDVVLLAPNQKLFFKLLKLKTHFQALLNENVYLKYIHTSWQWQDLDVLHGNTTPVCQLWAETPRCVAWFHICWGNEAALTPMVKTSADWQLVCTFCSGGKGKQEPHLRKKKKSKLNSICLLLSLARLSVMADETMKMAQVVSVAGRLVVEEETRSINLGRNCAKWVNHGM